MIASIQGIVHSSDPKRNSLVIVVGGIGCRVFVPRYTVEMSPGNELFLHTHLVVREDSLTLFGFQLTAELDLFEILLTVSGIGPKTALMVLGTLSPDSLRNAVLSERPEILTRVPGIGKKTAQRILLELKDKLKVGLGDAPIESFDDINTDVVDTLVALGYSIVEAQTAVQKLPHDAPPDVEERVRLALQSFM